MEFITLKQVNDKSVNESLKINNPSNHRLEQAKEFNILPVLVQRLGYFGLVNLPVDIKFTKDDLKSLEVNDNDEIIILFKLTKNMFIEEKPVKALLINKSNNFAAIHDLSDIKQEDKEQIDNIVPEHKVIDNKDIEIIE